MGKVKGGVKNFNLDSEFLENLEVRVKDIFSELTVDIDFIGKDKRDFFDQIDKKSVENLEWIFSGAWQKFIRIMTIKDSLVAKKPQYGQHNTDLISNYNWIIVLVEEHQPKRAYDRANVRKYPLESAKYGVRHQAKERTMLMNANGAVMGLREWLMMVWSPDVWFVVVFFPGQAQIYNELLSASNSQVRVDKGDVLLWHCWVSTEFINFIKQYERFLVILSLIVR